MAKITTAVELNSALLELEVKQIKEWILLKDQLLKAAEQLKPVNLLKSSFKEVSSIPDLKTNLFKAAVGFTTGLLIKNVSIVATQHPLMKIVGSIVEMVAANKAEKRNTKKLSREETTENTSISTPMSG